jgi:hypothetical protein
MKLNLSIQTSEPNGKTFRADFGIMIPVALFAMVFHLFGWF